MAALPPLSWSSAGRVFASPKGSEYYFENVYFWIKIGLFIAAGAISLIPTRRFIRWRKERRADPGFLPPNDEISGLRRIMLLEAGVFALIPVAAAVMARYD
jgi:putative membrane protein